MARQNLSPIAWRAYLRIEAIRPVKHPKKIKVKKERDAMESSIEDHGGGTGTMGF